MLPDIIPLRGHLNEMEYDRAQRRLVMLTGQFGLRAVRPFLTALRCEGRLCCSDEEFEHIVETLTSHGAVGVMQ